MAGHGAPHDRSKQRVRSGHNPAVQPDLATGLALVTRREQQLITRSPTCLHRHRHRHRHGGQFCRAAVRVPGGAAAPPPASVGLTGVPALDCLSDLRCRLGH